MARTLAFLLAPWHRLFRMFLIPLPFDFHLGRRRLPSALQHLAQGPGGRR